MGCRAGSVFVQLRPGAFGWIEFGRTGREFVHVQAWMAGQEVFHLAAAMDRMLVPDQYNGANDLIQEMLEESDHFVATQRAPMGLNVQLDPALGRTDTYGSDQIETLVVLDTGADRWRLSAGCPRAFERADQGEAAFIGKNQRGPQALPLFLYAARHSVSNEQLLHRRVRTCAVVVFGNSTPSVGADAKRRSDDSAR